MIELSHISAALRRTCSGVIAGACAVLRLIADRSFFNLKSSRQVSSHIRGEARLSQLMFTMGHGLRKACIALMLIAGLPSLAFAAIPVGTVISNTAVAQFSINGSPPILEPSNTIDITTVDFRTTSVIEFMQYAPTIASAELIAVNNTDYADGSSGGPLTAMTDPTPFGSATPVDISSPVPLVLSDIFHAGDIIFVRLTDLDQNKDKLLQETVTVTLSNATTGDSELIRLYETGADTGVFIGYIETATLAATLYDGSLSVVDSTSILASYVDNDDATDTEALAALVDPFGIILNSSTGLGLNGATVTLVNADTGLAATVLGDDGISAFPATLTSGSTATDSGGKVYSFPPGGYRFPFVSPGNYRLSVIPPVGYIAPSTVSTVDLQALPGGPFAIVSPGSRGETFVVNPGPALHIDYPVDPLGTGLYVRKKASKRFVAQGDFLQYKVDVVNASSTDVINSTLTDKLPHGFIYEKGSARFNGLAVADPTISADGRTLTFDIGTIVLGTSIEISYVTEVGAGSRTGEVTNLALASGDGGLPIANLTSNTAKAVVTVKEELFRSEAIIVGKVFANGCKEENDMAGLGGVRIFMEDGTLAISDKDGKFHFKGIKPGTHVVQLDVDTVPPMYEVVQCEENSRFADRPFSQFVDIQGGTMWRTDFHLKLRPRAKGEISIEMLSAFREDNSVELLEKALFQIYSSSSVDERWVLDENTEQASQEKIKEVIQNRRLQSGKRIVDYRIPITVGQVDLRKLRLTVMLPPNVEYLSGSSSIDKKAVEDPFIITNSLTFQMGDGEANSGKVVSFSALVSSGDVESEYVTRALLTFDTPGAVNVRSPLVENILINIEKKEQIINPDIILRPQFEAMSAELSEDYKRQLDDLVAAMKNSVVLHISVTGHTDSLVIRARAKDVFKDNYELSEARAESVGDYLMDILDLDLDQLSFSGEGADYPIASNDTEKGRALNRRVELKVESEKLISWIEMEQEKDSSGVEKMDTAGLRPGEVWEKDVKKIEIVSEYDKALNDETPGFEWLWPKEGYYPNIPSVRVVVKHDSLYSVRLYLDGRETSSLNFDGTVKSNSGKVVKNVWRGVDLRDGENRFEAVLIDGDGIEKGRIKRKIYYAGLPVNVHIVKDKSFLVANGKSSPLVALKLTDKNGEPAREGLIGTFSVDPPYMPAELLDELSKNPVTGNRKELYRYKVGKDGIAYIHLAPTTKTAEVVLRLRLAKGEEEARTWLTSEPRDWILVGFAEGVAGHNTLSGNMEGLESKSVDEDIYSDGKLAFYAKGRIKGSWLLTMAYDSEKKRSLEREKLHQTIDPDKYYTLYGDGSEELHDGASSSELYLKIERDKFYALYGDFDTGLKVTELSRYNRTMNGFKSEMKGENIEYSIYASETANAFIKDEIRGNGTSGLYKLSRNNIVINSDSLEIEVRDRFRSEVILSSRKLARHLDYNIDYDEGTIYFKEPIFSTDQNFNPLYIVVDYEINDSSESSLNYGGRAALKLFGGSISTGLSHIHEGTPGGEGNLYGMDVVSILAKGITLKAEVASSESDYLKVERDGNAYLAEITKISDRLEGKLYYREMEEGFGLGQQRGSEYGMRKTGMEGKYSIGGKTSLSGQLFRQSNLLTDADRDHGEIKTTYGGKGYSLFAGLRGAKDSFSDGSSEESSHLELGGNLALMGNRLNTRLSHDYSLKNESESADYPSRTILGADYKLSRNTSLFVDHEFADGAYEDSESTRVGFKANPWTGGDIHSSLDRSLTENGIRVFSNLGLKQTVNVSKKWSLDAGMDRVETISKESRKSLNVGTPPASGASEDFTALSAGLAYRADKWSWTLRGEKRDASTSNKVGMFTGVNGEIRDGLGMSLGLKAFNTEYENGDSQESADLRVSVASRPKKGRWIILDRLDLIYEEEDKSSFNLDSWKIINNLNTNYKLNHKMMIALQYAAKYVKDNIDEESYSGYTDLVGFEGAFDITKKMDIGLKLSALHSWRSDNYDYSAGLATGYNFAKNIWLSLGYNFIGFHDSDFSKGSYTAEGVYIKFRIKFDQQTMRDLAKGSLF